MGFGGPSLGFRVLGVEERSMSEPHLFNVKRFRGGLVFKAHTLVYHSTLGWRVIKRRLRGAEHFWA